jgi:tRNA nucleotidyltransferase (CCA-adding enzyme)
LIDRLSGDRIRHELNLILSSSLAPQVISRLHSLDLLAAIHSNLTWDNWLYARLELLDNIQPEPDWGLNNDPTALRRELGYTLWLIELTPEQADGVVRRLKLPVQLARVIQAACSLWRERRSLAAALPSQITERLEDVPPLACYALYIATSDVQLRSVLLKFATNWRKIQSSTDGHVLKELGVSPGPHYRQILSALRNAWLDGEIHTQEEEYALLEELLLSYKVLDSKASFP